jgi:hypothetical protein
MGILSTWIGFRSALSWWKWRCAEPCKRSHERHSSLPARAATTTVTCRRVWICSSTLYVGCALHKLRRVCGSRGVAVRLVSLEQSVDVAVVEAGKECGMRNPSRDLEHHNIEADELQVQRERLHQALLSGASLEDTVDLMRAMRALLPQKAHKQIPPRVDGKFAAASRKVKSRTVLCF